MEGPPDPHFKAAPACSSGSPVPGRETARGKLRGWARAVAWQRDAEAGFLIGWDCWGRGCELWLLGCWLGGAGGWLGSLPLGLRTTNLLSVQLQATNSLPTLSCPATNPLVISCVLGWEARCVPLASQLP